MLSWRDAHRIANMAAAQAHAALNVDLTGTRVDITAAIHTAGVELMWQPLPRVFGVYVNEPGACPGVLVNSGLPPGARRHTAAHELGHHQLRHTTSVDDGSTIDTVAAEEIDVIPAGGRRGWSDQEKVAEAFAAWFLMPRRVVDKALTVLGLSRLQTTVDVYRLSLLLGTSYRSTVRHLPNIRLAHAQNSAEWGKCAPRTVKALLDHGAPRPATRKADVWVIDEGFAGVPLHLYPGDRVVLPDVAASDVEMPEWLSLTGVTDGAPFSAGPVLEVSHLSEPAEGQLSMSTGTNVSWSCELIAAPTPRGLDLRQPR